VDIGKMAFDPVFSPDGRSVWVPIKSSNEIVIVSTVDWSIAGRFTDAALKQPHQIVFSPDGRTAFVNIQSPGLTFAIWGPFARRRPDRQRVLAAARPPARLGPRVSPELAEAAQRHGLGELEAAAYDRLAVALA
jgi:hypothetical protein